MQALKVCITDHARTVVDTFIAHCQAYKRAALKYHPDKAPREERDEAERKFKQARLLPSDPDLKPSASKGQTSFHGHLCIVLLGMLSVRLAGLGVVGMVKCRMHATSHIA